MRENMMRLAIVWFTLSFGWASSRAVYVLEQTGWIFPLRHQRTLFLCRPWSLSCVAGVGPSRNQSLPADQYCSISVSGGGEIRVIAEGKIEKKRGKKNTGVSWRLNRGGACSPVLDFTRPSLPQFDFQFSECITAWRFSLAASSSSDVTELSLWLQVLWPVGLVPWCHQTPPGGWVCL